MVVPSHKEQTQLPIWLESKRSAVLPLFIDLPLLAAQTDHRGAACTNEVLAYQLVGCRTFNEVWRVAQTPPFSAHCALVWSSYHLFRVGVVLWSLSGWVVDLTSGSTWAIVTAIAAVEERRPI